MTRALRGRVRRRTSVHSRVGFSRAPVPSRPGPRRRQARQQGCLRHRGKAVPDGERLHQPDERSRPPIVEVLSFLERRCEFAEQSDGHLQREMALLLTLALVIILMAGGLAVAAAVFACVVIAVQEYRQDTLAATLPSIVALMYVAGAAVAAAVSRRWRVRHS